MILLNHKFIKDIPRKSLQDMVLTKKITNYRFELKIIYKIETIIRMVWKDRSQVMIWKKIIINHYKLWFKEEHYELWFEKKSLQAQKPLQVMTYHFKLKPLQTIMVWNGDYHKYKIIIKNDLKYKLWLGYLKIPPKSIISKERHFKIQMWNDKEW